MSYVLPQVKVFQQFKQISRTVVGNLNACIIGPNYTLARYGESSEKELTELGVDYLGEALVHAYPNGVKGVDASYVKVFFEDVVAEYAQLANAGIYSGVVYNNFVKDTVSKLYNDKEPTVTAELISGSKFKPSSSLPVASGDRLYFLPGASSTFSLFYRSALTDAVLELGSGLTFTSGEYEPSTGDLVGLKLTSVAGSGNYVTPAKTSVVVNAESTSNGTTTKTPLFTIALRPEAIAEYIDMLESDPELYASLPPLYVSEGESVVVEHSRGCTRLTVPSITDIRATTVDFGSNTEFNKYFTLTIADGIETSGSSAWVADEGVETHCDWTGSGGAAYGATICTLGTVADLKVGIGDTFTHTNGGTVFENSVYAFAYADSVSHIAPVVETTPSQYATAGHEDSASGYWSVLSASEITVSGSYTGKVDTVYTIEVLSKGVPNSHAPKFRITDSAGIDEPRDIDDFDSYAASNLTFKLTTRYGGGANGDNLTVTIPAGKVIVAGQTFAVACSAAEKASVNGFQPTDLSTNEFGVGYDTATGVALASISIGKPYGSLEIPATDTESGTINWTASDEAITLHKGIKVTVENSTLTDDDDVELTIASGKPFVQYRYLTTRYSDTVYTAANTNDVQTMLGAVSMDNPLAQGVYHAVLNSGEQPVYFIAIPSDNHEGYRRALERLEKTDDIYGLVPMTFDDVVLDDIQAHVKAMSGPEAKLWRIAIVGFSTDKTISVYNEAKHPLDRDYTATIEGTRVTFTSTDDTLARDEVWPGDKFRYDFRSDGTYSEIEIDHVVSNNIIVLKEAVEYAVTTPSKCEVWRDLTAAQWIEYVANKASAFADRRMYAVFPEVLWNNDVKYPGYIGAAAIAGLISSVPPQQGLTHITLNGFDDIPMTYSSYTRTQLNTVAEHGGLIIMQDVPEGPIYIRHQVSTAAMDGNVLTTELSVTKNLDAISYYFAEVLAPYIGKYNITPLLLRQIETTVKQGLSYLGSYNTGSGLLGPMLLLDSGETRINGIQQHETLKDHVIISLSLDLPLPCNVIELYLSV